MRARANPFAPPAVSPEQEAADKSAEDRAAASALVDCAICLECVMSKERIGERRFGLLSGCSHAFCLACIRGWRDGGRGLHSSTFRLNVSAFRGIGGASRGCVGGVKGLLGCVLRQKRLKLS
jgi:hypothetical protein